MPKWLPPKEFYKNQLLLFLGKYSDPNLNSLFEKHWYYLISLQEFGTLVFELKSSVKKGQSAAAAFMQQVLQKSTSNAILSSGLSNKTFLYKVTQ